MGERGYEVHWFEMKWGRWGDPDRGVAPPPAPASGDYGIEEQKHEDTCSNPATAQPF